MECDAFFYLFASIFEPVDGCVCHPFARLCLEVFHTAQFAVGDLSGLEVIRYYFIQGIQIVTSGPDVKLYPV
tara:strand:+ start:703 stop:918 length:216 start_codon:yes stop_codon:yes gene_type:complete